MPDDLRERMIARVMHRDRLSKSAAIAIVNSIHPNELIRLEMETCDRNGPVFTAEYNPFGM